MIHYVRWDYSQALLKETARIPHDTVAEAEQRKGMLTAEPVIIAMDALYKYAVAHALEYDSTLSEDSFLGPEWLQAITGVRALLNGAGHFDGGTLEGLFWQALEASGFEESDL